MLVSWGRVGKCCGNPDKAGRWLGLTDNYIRVTAHSDRELANQITWARIIALNGQSVIAEVV